MTVSPFAGMPAEPSMLVNVPKLVITPSHNPPHEGGFKYNPPHGGPAELGITGWIEAKANEFLEHGLQGVKRMPFEKALRASTTHRHDYNAHEPGSSEDLSRPAW